MDAEAINHMAQRIARLIGARYGVRGADLAEVLHHGGRKLPARLAHAAEGLASAQSLARHPKLRGQIDLAGARAAYKRCLRALRVGGASRFWREVYIALASIGLGLIVILGGLYAYLHALGRV